MQQEIRNRPSRGVRRLAVAGLAALCLGAFLVLLVSGPAGCRSERGDGIGSAASPMARVTAPEADSRSPGLPSIPDLAPQALGKPYRDLRRHTTHPLGEVSGIDISPDGGTIIFASTQDGATPNIYMKREGSAGVIRKTSGRSWDIQPRISPNGDSIAFASDRDGNFDVWIIPAHGAGGLEQVTSSTDDEVHPTWSPDGNKLAICRLSKTHGWNLWILDRQDQSAMELGPGLFPDWSPTGEWIAFQKPSDREPHWFGIWIIRPDGSEVRQVVTPEGFWAVEPAWSPAGDMIAYAAARKTLGDARRSDGGRIWVVELVHGKTFRLTDGPGTDACPVWGLGGRLYFISDRLEGRSVWSLVPPEVKE